MKYAELREAVYAANMGLVEAGLVVLTWGNASGVDRNEGVLAIKPSGVDYKQLRPEHIVVLDLETGAVVDGDGRPSSDTPTHLALCRAFPALGGVVHTHSRYATAFAQAGVEIPCLGTTHADSFYGAIPVTRPLNEAEIREAYEANTGSVIIERFRDGGLDPTQVPGVLVANHGPFTWGSTAAKALENAVVLDFVAGMALDTYRLANCPPIPQVLLDKHFLRKHGPGAYYGQPVATRKP
ncbi:MAG TPA: L-ribulose-5-phosphate 4-epimerase AraD [Armatimonadota bacterium]|jgi:L-ribulose-5-phosphate 4-epimerase